VHYSVPCGFWLLGTTGSTYAYHQSVAGAFQTYRYSGESENADIRLSRLIYRDAQRKTTASLRGWLRTQRNFIDDTEVEVQRRRTAGWEAGLSHRQFWGAKVLDANLAYRRGTGALGAMAAPEEAFGEGTSRMQLITADVQFDLPFEALGRTLRYGATARAQWNRTPLTPQDRFAIGNRYTVRGFDGETTLSAERGWLLRNELGLGWREAGAELYAGVDWGEVSGPSTVLLLGRQLAGAVVGLRGAFRQVSYEFFVGKPIDKPEGFRTSSTTAGFSLNWAL
jgi:hemolysin activation/secretion protein